MSSSPLLIIYNPEAGRANAAGRVPLPLPPFVNARTSTGIPRWLEETQAYLRVESGADVPAIPAVSFEQAAREAREAAQNGVETVIAAGGDGTLRAVAEGLAGMETALGILPRGTVNVLAREVGIPLEDPLRALDICLHGDTRAVDLGRVGDRYFLLMCSVGFDALAVSSVNPDLKGVVGAPAYVLAGMAALAAFTPPQLTLTLEDGETRREMAAFMVVIANTASYGGDFRIAPEADITDGLLDVCVFEAPPGPVPLQRAAFIRQMGEMAMGMHLLNPDISYYRARRISVNADPAAPVQIDGDPLGSTPLLVGVAPGALRVRVPHIHAP